MSEQSTPETDTVFELIDLAVRRAEAGHNTEGQAAFRKSLMRVQKLELERNAARLEAAEWQSMVEATAQGAEIAKQDFNEYRAEIAQLKDEVKRLKAAMKGDE